MKPLVKPSQEPCQTGPKSPAAANRSIALFCSVFIDIAHLICFVLISSIYSGGEKRLSRSSNGPDDRSRKRMHAPCTTVRPCVWLLIHDLKLKYAVRTHVWRQGPRPPWPFPAEKHNALHAAAVLARERKALEKQRRRRRMNMHHDVIQVWHTVHARLVRLGAHSTKEKRGAMHTVCLSE